MNFFLLLIFGARVFFFFAIKCQLVVLLEKFSRLSEYSFVGRQCANVNGIVGRRTPRGSSREGVRGGDGTVGKAEAELEEEKEEKTDVLLARFVDLCVCGRPLGDRLLERNLDVDGPPRGIVSNAGRKSRRFKSARALRRADCSLSIGRFPGWFCFALGAFLHALFAIYKDRFHDTYTDRWAKSGALERLPYRALRVLYTYTFGVACNAHWRGGWIIIDDYLFTHMWRVSRQKEIERGGERERDFIEAFKAILLFI